MCVCMNESSPVAITLVNYRAPEQHSCISYDVVILAVLIPLQDTNTVRMIE